MQIVPYPHPALAYRSVDIQRIDSTLRQTVRNMFDLMYEAEGIGLAANQVGLPFRFFVMNLQARPGEEDMEWVFINPVIRKRKGSVVGEEGCLSLPGLYGDVTRSEELVIEAFDLDGQGFEMDLDDLPARVVQHETDHLDGILFTDRMRDEGTSEQMDLHLPKFTDMYRQAQKQGHLRSDDELKKELDLWAKSGGVPSEFLERPLVEIQRPKLKES